jgi:hypothetical protein
MIGQIPKSPHACLLRLWRIRQAGTFYVSGCDFENLPLLRIPLLSGILESGTAVV